MTYFVSFHLTLNGYRSDACMFLLNMFTPRFSVTAMTAKGFSRIAFGDTTPTGANPSKTYFLRLGTVLTFYRQLEPCRSGTVRN